MRASYRAGRQRLSVSMKGAMPSQKSHRRRKRTTRSSSESTFHSRRQRQARDDRRRWLIKRLKQAAAENSRVDPRLTTQQKRRQVAVDAAEPTRLPEHIETAWVLEEEQSFSFAVAALLFDIVANGVAAKMPYHGSRAKADLVSFILQSPAEIHIVAGGAKDRIKSIDRFQRFPPERHIAAGNMLGDFIIQQAREPVRPGKPRRTTRRRNHRAAADSVRRPRRSPMIESALQDASANPDRPCNRRR